MGRTPNPKQLDLFDDWHVESVPVVSNLPQDAPEQVLEQQPVEETTLLSVNDSRYLLAKELASKLNQDGEITSEFLTNTARCLTKSMLF
jgi:hypothetical protein